MSALIPGRSAFAAFLFAGFLVGGCSDSVGPNSLSYEGITTIVSAKPMMIQTTVTVRNVSNRTITIDRNICPTWYTAHLTASRDDAPAWSYPEAGRWECAAWAGPLDLAPGDYYQFEKSMPLPPTTPDGFWFLTLIFAVRENVELPVGQISVNQGTVYKP